MSEESNINFVGGKAIEQTESLESNTPSDERAAAAKAVKEAMAKAAKEEAKEAKADEPKPKASKPKAEPKEKPDADDSDDDDSDDIEERSKDPHGVERFKKKLKEEPDDDEEDSTPVRGPDGKFLPKAKAKEPEEEDEDIDPSKASVSQLLKNRQKIANLKREKAQAEEAARMEREEGRKAREMWQTLEKRQKEVEAQEARWRMLNSDPAQALRQLGREPEEFIMSLANEGTPEGQLARKMKELDARLARIDQWEEQQKVQAKTYQQQLQQRQYEEGRRAAEKELYDKAATRKHVAHWFKDDNEGLLAKADWVADAFRDLSGGRDASIDDILDHIEEDLAKRASGWYQVGEGSQKVKTADDEDGKPAKGKGKSLSPNMSGERRATSPRDMKDLDDDERKAEAKRRVARALGR